jgi:hypothetical protein
MKKKLSQIAPTTLAPISEAPQDEVENIEDLSKTKEEEQKEMYQKELLYTEKQIQMLQDKVTNLRQLAAQNMNTMNQSQPINSPMKELDRIDQADQQNVDQQQEVNLAQQDMQQEKLLQDQRMRQEQDMQMMQMTQRTSANWVRSERVNVRIAIKNTTLTCDVAATPRQQASGLQAYDRLSDNNGLWFPFASKRTASFHMGEVKFPIDIIFIDDSRINKIISNIQPRQIGSWKSVCTDVVEVNGGWCKKNGINVGDYIHTPLTGKKRASYSEIEKILNTSWSAPQDARVSDKESAANSYDSLRTITTADAVDSEFENEMLATFPFLKEAQEHRQPDTTDKRSPDVKDKRNPQIRFRHNTTPDAGTTFGDGDSDHVDPFQPSSDGNYGKEFDYQRGWWPSPKSEHLQEGVPIRPGQKITVGDQENIDIIKLVGSSVLLYETHTPEWNDYSEDGGEYDKIAIINDDLISTWIDTLGFNSGNEEKLREVMFTNSYKTLLGDTLMASNKINDYEVFDSDLLLYK